MDVAIAAARNNVATVNEMVPLQGGFGLDLQSSFVWVCCFCHVHPTACYVQHVLSKRIRGVFGNPLSFQPGTDKTSHVL